ncbi:MAG TPA: hypothetical protein VGL79_05685 [Solirubrobacteraceae bacterium]
MSGAQGGDAAMPADGGAAYAGAPGQATDSGPGERLARIVFVLLVIGCFAALLITQRLKHTPTLVQEPKLTHVIEPASTGESKEEHIAFKLAKTDRVTVVVESASGETVATLVRDLPVGRYKTLSLRWNGHRGGARGYSLLRKADGYTTLVPHNHGALAPPGEYSVRVELRQEDRSVPFPHTFKLVGP